MLKSVLLILSLVLPLAAHADYTRAFEMKKDQYVMVQRCSNGVVSHIPYTKEALLEGVEYTSAGKKYEAKLVVKESGKNRGREEP